MRQWKAIAFDQDGTLLGYRKPGVEGGELSLVDILRRPPAFYPHAIEILLALRELEVPLALVTSSPRALVEEFWSRTPTLFKGFRVVIASEDSVRQKPHPMPYRLAAEGLNVLPRELCVVENSVEGIQAGRGAGCSVIAVAHTDDPAHLKCYTETVVANLRELHELLSL